MDEEGLSVCRYDVEVDLTVPDAKKLFLEIVWKKLGFQSHKVLGCCIPHSTWTVAAGDDQGNGACRIVPGKYCPMMKEKVLEATDDKIVYTVVWGPLPVSYHQGCVSFEMLEENKTKVVWEVKFRPYCCCGGIVRSMIRLAFPTGLQSLKEASERLVQDEKQLNP